MVGDPRQRADYVAFLSYSHVDAREARRLHQQLESYRLPRRLVGTAGDRGPVPPRLVPIFRDREELPAGRDLSEQVRAALAASQSLVVLCSPSSAKSQWVQREIETFRELHPARPVLAAIIAGDPVEAFPAALTIADREPVAADLRPDRDGRRLGLLKLIAGISGVRLDALVQRDAQRRLRRVMAVTVGAVIGMLIMGILTSIAIRGREEADRQRAEAERQRGEAEGMVEFMLTDLRDKLHGAGSLSAMTAVNERALLYYGSRLDLESLPDDSLARLAQLFQLIGEDSLALDNAEAAMSAFKQASRITDEQLARRPTDPEHWEAHARSLGSLSRIEEKAGNWEASEHYLATVSTLADRLLSTDAANPDYLARAASAAFKLGNFHLLGTKDYPAAQRAFDKSIALLDRALRLRPNNTHFLLLKSNALGGLADSFYYRKDWPASLSARSRQYAIVMPLHKADKDNAERRFYLAAAERGLAYSLMKVGSGPTATALLQAAHARVRELVLLDPRNATWRVLESKLEEDLSKEDARPRETVSLASQ